MSDGEDCGGPEPARNPDPYGCLQPNAYDKASETEVSDDDDDDNDDWQKCLDSGPASSTLCCNAFILCKAL